jgi:hypothetical protein
VPEHSPATTMTVFVLIDTNVLMQYRFFDEVDWPKELSVQDVMLVFAPVVFVELDRYKWAGSRRQKERARAVLKKLNTLALSTTPVAIRPGVQALAPDAEPPDELFTQHRLHPQSSDDRLLASYFSFRDEHAADRLLVLSADSGLATKARSRRIELMAPDDALELPDEPDKVERELEKTRRELAEARSAAPNLNLTFGEGATHRQFEVQPVKAIDSQTRRRLLEAWRKRYPHAAPTLDSFEFGGQKISLGSFAGLPGFLSEKEAAEYNASVDRVFARYEAFLTSWPAAVSVYRRVLPFKLVLENSGTAPATDVDVQLWTKAPGVWRDDLPKLPARAPGLRKARSPFEIIARLPYLDHLADVRVPALNANEDGPNISEGPDQRVQYGVKRVMHHVLCELPVVYFQFDSDDAVGSFAVNARLVAANIRKPRIDALHVEVTRPEPGAPPPPPEPGEEPED